MKLLTGCLVLAILSVSVGADAWPWSRRNRKPKLPKAIDSPVVRPKLQAEKVTRQVHPSRVQRPEWGQDERQYRTIHPREGNHSIFRD
jgi:hypothetical protein